MKLKIKLLNDEAVIPYKGSNGAGAYDVVAAEIVDIGIDFKIVKLGFAVEIPTGYRLIIVPRSSITNDVWIIQNSPCTIDEDFRGEIQLRFRCLPSDIRQDNLYYRRFPYEVGDRVAQMYLEPVIDINFIETDELSDTKRGEGKYGSTGK